MNDNEVSLMGHMRAIFRLEDDVVKLEHRCESQRLILRSIVDYFDQFPDLISPTTFHPHLEAARKALQ